MRPPLREDRRQVQGHADGATSAPRMRRLSAASDEQAAVGAEPERRGGVLAGRPREEGEGEGDDLNPDGEDEEPETAKLKLGEPAEAAAERKRERKRDGDGEELDHLRDLFRWVSDSEPRPRTTQRSRALTISGSNCVPAQRRTSARASVAELASRYVRSVVIASKASATRITREPRGMSSPARPSG